MDTRPIGIFDSGVGGLTVAKEIYSHLPLESTIYIGDTARVPYGPRSRETVIRFSRQLVKFLLNQNVKLIVVACSTVSAQALTTLQKENSIPIIGVIEPSAKTTATSTRSKHIIVIGTKGTIESEAFVKAINRHNPSITIEQQACPLFVPLIEEGITKHSILNPIIDHYLNRFKTTMADHLILGCTHYPLIAHNIISYLNNPKISVVNPAIATAKATKTFLLKHELSSPSNTNPWHTYYTTDNPNSFRSIAQKFLGKPIHHQTHYVNIDSF